MQLHARAGGLGRDAVAVRRELLRAVDGDRHVFAARGEDLLVEHPVALVGGHEHAVHVLLGQRRQDAGHDQQAADGPRPRVRGVQLGADLPLEVRQGVAGQPPRRHVDLEVELAELGRPGRAGDRLQHVRVAHGRRAMLIDDVQLDLLADLRGIGVEHALAEHAGEHVELAADLVAVLAPVLSAYLDGLDVTAHVGLLPWPGRVTPGRRCAVRGSGFSRAGRRLPLPERSPASQRCTGGAGRTRCPAGSAGPPRRRRFWLPGPGPCRCRRRRRRR